MGREIKFRGQDKANKKWLYGNLEIPLLNQNKSKHYILGYSYGQYQKHEVDPKTVGQYTGLKDKNGLEIYVSDIVKCSYFSFKFFNAQIKFGEYKQDGSGGEYSPNKCMGFYAEAINKEITDEYDCKIIDDYLETTSLLVFDEVEVIGNIYDNPELLEVNDNE